MKLGLKFDKDLYKHGLILLTILFTISFIFASSKREIIYMRLGDFAFGGKILGVRLYNISLAEMFYAKAAELNPVPLWANYQLSRVNFIKGNQDDAVKYANKELEIYPNNCRTNYVRGLAYAYDDKLNSAIENFKRFNICFPESWAGHNDLAWLYFRQGDYESARRTIEQVVHKFPTNPWIQNSYGVALMNTGDLKTAVYAFAAADRSARVMTESDWGKAYPGNDRRIYGEGLEAMRKTILDNIALLKIKRENYRE